jgi:hypothetical protein
VKLIKKVMSKSIHQQMQKEAAIHARHGEFELAVIKMIGCFYQLNRGDLERRARQQVVPNWLEAPTLFAQGQVPSIESRLVRGGESLGEHDEVVSAILDGNFGDAVQYMIAATYEPVIENMAADIDEVEALRMTDIKLPWGELIEEMAPSTNNWPELSKQSQMRISEHRDRSFR